MEWESKDEDILEHEDLCTRVSSPTKDHMKRQNQPDVKKQRKKKKQEATAFFTHRVIKRREGWTVVADQTES